MDPGALGRSGAAEEPGGFHPDLELLMLVEVEVGWLADTRRDDRAIVGGALTRGRMAAGQTIAAAL